MITTILGYIIIVFGIINSFRMASLFVGGEIYDFFWSRKMAKKANKRSRPLVSVVIAAYNEEKVIALTLSSVLASTYKHIKIIVVNDGSKDKTKRVVNSYIKKHQLTNIVFISQKNGGKANALNNGITNHARGSLVMTLDADSIIAPDAIENVVKYFGDATISAVAANVKIIKTDSLLGVIQYIEYLMGYRLKKAYTIYNNEYIIGGIGSTFRRSILKKVNYYDTDTITEDIDLTMKILMRGNKKHKVVYAEDVICFTEPVMSLKDLYRQRYRWKFGRFQTLYKNWKIIFNLSSKYTKLLTFGQIPFVFYSELAFLIDPILIGFVIYLGIKYQETASWIGIFGFLAFYVAGSLISDKYLKWKEKLQYLVFAPISYFFFFIVSIIEYVALIKSIVNYKRIIYAKEINECGWEHVARAG